MKIIGHRGARGLAPENTLAAIRKGMAYGVDELELDIRLTRDDIPVLNHNSTLIAHGQKIILVAHTLEELRTYKPDITTLAEALELVHSKTILSLEVKPAEQVEPIVQLLKKYLRQGYDPKRILLGSKSQLTLRELHRELPLIQNVVIEKWSGVRGTWRARQVGTKRLSMRSWWLWSGFLKSMQKHGYQVSPYTMNDPEKVAKWAPYLYGVITDYPDRFKP